MQQQEKHRAKLVTYLNDLPVEKQRDFAVKCDTTIGQMRQIAYGCRPCRTEMAIAIDRESNGVVTMDYMAPQIDWDFVRRTLSRRMKRNGAEG